MRGPGAEPPKPPRGEPDTAGPRAALEGTHERSRAGAPRGRLHATLDLLSGAGLRRADPPLRGLRIRDERLHARGGGRAHRLVGTIVILLAQRVRAPG
jgi:hypothetical protein